MRGLWMIVSSLRRRAGPSICIRTVNETFREIKLDKHPDKTFTGKVKRGFDLLGYHFSPEGLTVEKKILLNFVERAIQLYEQERGSPKGDCKLRKYGHHRPRWALGGLGGLRGWLHLT